MGEVINLNKARKARERLAGQKQVQENRLRHGETKAQKQRGAARTS